MLVWLILPTRALAEEHVVNTGTATITVQVQPTPATAHIPRISITKSSNLRQKIRSFSQAISGHPVNHTLTLTASNGQTITHPLTRSSETLSLSHDQLSPGRYQLTVDNQLATDFSWGVLSVNTDQSTYLTNTPVYLQMSALNEYGHTLCNANLELVLTLPNGKARNYQTADNSISSSPTCGPDNVTDVPDYFLHYSETALPGTYTLTLTNLDNHLQFHNSFTVTSSPPAAIITRIGATRINPYRASYTMTLKVMALTNLHGVLTDTLPPDFVLAGQSPSSWPLSLSAGETHTFSYTYSAPRISPRLFTLGPVTITDGVNPILSQSNNWYLASDGSCTSRTGTRSWSVGGDWLAGCTGAGGIPGTGDDVSLASGVAMTYDVTGASINTLTFNGGASTATLTHSGTNALTVTSATTSVTINQPTSAGNNNWNINGGSATLAGTLVMAGTNTGAGLTNKVILTTGTLTVNGATSLSFAANTTVANHQIVCSGGAATINLAGSITNATSATSNPGTAGCTWNYNGSSAQTVPMAFGTTAAYNNLTINNTNVSGASPGAAITATAVTGNLSVGNISSGSLLSVPSFATTGAGTKTFRVYGGSTFTMTGTSTYPTGFATITLDSTSTVNYAQTTTPLTITAASYGNLGMTPGGTVTQNLPAGTLTVAGNLTCGDGTNAATCSANAASTTLNVGGNLMIAAASTFVASATNTLSVSGNWTNSGTFTHSSGTVALTGADSSTQAISGNSTFNNFSATTTANTAGRTLQFTGASTTTVAGTWTVNGASGKVLTLQSSNGSNWTIAPTTSSVDYVSLSHSTNTVGTICATHSTGDGTNSGYTISAGATCTNSAPATPSLDLPTTGATNQPLTPILKTTATDPESDYLRYKIVLCTDLAMSIGCQTFDQTVSQTGWSGQNTQTSTAYTSGTQGVYTVQSALNNSITYYWQSYAIDPAGSNTWGSTQGTPFSFTTLAASPTPTPTPSPTPSPGSGILKFQGVNPRGIKIN